MAKDICCHTLFVLVCLQRYIISYEKSWHRIEILLYTLIFNVFADFQLIISTHFTVNTHLKLLRVIVYILPLLSCLVSNMLHLNARFDPEVIDAEHVWNGESMMAY